MGMICPNCERPIKDMDHVRFHGLAIFHKNTAETHAIEVYQEEEVIHLICNE